MNNYDDEELWQQAEERVTDSIMNTSYCDRDTRDFQTQVMAVYDDLRIDREAQLLDSAKDINKYGH